MRKPAHRKVAAEVEDRRTDGGTGRAPGIAGVALAGAIALATLPSPSLAQPADLRVQKLTPLGQSFSDLISDPGIKGTVPQVSADGKWVLYWFDGDTDEVPDLYVASRFGGNVRRLSTVRPAGANSIHSETWASFTPDSRRVVFWLDQETANRAELWSVPVEGDAADAVKLSGAIDPALQVAGGVTLTADGERAIFLTDASEQLWSAPIDGSSPAVRLDPALGPSDVIDGPRLVGDDVVFLDDQAGVSQLWRAPLDGSAAAVRLNGDLVAGGSVQSFLPAPDGTRIVYRADQRFDEVIELWSVPIGGPGSSAVRLSPTLPAFGDVRSGFQVASGVGRVLFRVDSGVDEQFELWSAPITGPATSAVHLNVPLVANGDVSTYSSLGDRVVYLADNAVDEIEQAWIVPIDGPFSASVRLHGDLGANQEVALAALVPASPEPNVLLLSNLRDAGKLDLFLQHDDGVGDPYPLFGDPPAGIGYRSSCGSGGPPDVSWVIVCADLFALDKIELYRLDFTFSSTPDRLSSLFQIADGDVTKVVVSPDGAWAIFRADSALDERFDLLRVRTDGSAQPQRVHAAPPSANYDVDEDILEFTPDGAGIVYAADHATNGKLDLWISDAMIFRADFEGEGFTEWSAAFP